LAMRTCYNISQTLEQSKYKVVPTSTLPIIVPI
jgi:hypothetical protein